MAEKKFHQLLSIKLLYKSPLSSLISSWKRRKNKMVKRAMDDPPKDQLQLEYVQSIPEAQIYKGVLLQGYLVPADLLEGLEDMPIRRDDVFIITYPKSGTTWTEEIVSLICQGGDVEKVKKEPLVYRVHHLEVGSPFGHSRFLKKLPSPRLMATHLPLPLLPRDLRNPKCKIIYVMRNPKDTAVSYYHHHKISSFLGNASHSWDKFLAYFMAGHVVYGSWFDHVLPYWEFCKRNPNKVFFLSYEELKLDLGGMVRRLSDFLKQPLSVEEVDAIVNHCSFESMKTNKMVNRENLPISDLFDMTQSKFMRKGIIGDWKNYFTQEQSEEFDEVCSDRLSGCDLPILDDPEEVIRYFSDFGRIIYNAPEASLSSDEEEDESEDESSYSREMTVRNCYSFIPQMQLHVQPDPLTLDSLG
ncbi:sulfotransferase 1A3 [Parasteatoda tepidariorum]|uniref:sulfotransferase 1A3 n=1 Tax=Parasteatoda tepidariorum TaxID=114398 RepID=UPI001C729CEB|nr:sulfotransferase 1A3 [Parasteatoda tepidariorum]